MDTKQLLYFKTIVEQGTISKAAQVLHMSQPPLSLQMHQLEQEVGCPLFYRGARKITCTQEGEYLYHRATTILQLMNRTKLEIKEQQNGELGKLHIGIVSSCHEYALKNWIQTFAKKYPKIQYEITEANTYNLIEEVNNHKIECAFVRTPFSIPNTMEAISFETEALYCIGLKKDEPISLKELANQPLVIYRRWKNLFDEYFEKHQCKVNYACICDDTRTSIRWAEAGLGLAITPESSLSYLSLDIPYTQIDQTEFSSQICLIKNKDSYVSRPTQLFLEMVQKNKK